MFRMSSTRAGVASGGAGAGAGAGSGLGALVVALGLVVGVAGCATEKEPPVYPSVQWQGAAPTGALEADPWVQAVRAELEAEAVARNRNDFSIPELADTATEGYVDRASASAIQMISNHDHTDLYPGPRPFLPAEVETDPWDTGDDVAAVRGCVAGEWSTESGRPEGDLEAFGIEYRMERDHDGVIRIDSSGTYPDLDCDALGELPVALFDPVPEPSGITEARDVVRPDGTTSGGAKR